ncbi:MAG: exonuclease domain-containing protein [Propionibacteriaceae bacterium]
MTNLYFGAPMTNTTYVVVDLETTGTAFSDSITEIGAVKVCNGVILDQFSSLVNPQRPISALVTQLTGITNAMVATAPPLTDVLPRFLSFARGCVLVAHNARFDMGFLQRSGAMLGYDWPDFPVLDTVTLARNLLPRSEVPNYKLGTLAAYFNTSIQPNHRALDDALATTTVLYELFRLDPSI